MRKLVVFSGAGVSEESGIATFRTKGGIWEKYNVEDVATPDAWKKNKKLVLDFYNMRRQDLLAKFPNDAHFCIKQLESEFDVTVITQNIDDLHERAGTKKVIHLHGELLKSRSTIDPSLTYLCKEDINIGDKCEKGSQLRPDVVWFGETVNNLDTAKEIVEGSDVFLVVGTSLSVWPAAGLLYLANNEVWCIDPQKPNELEMIKDINYIRAKASDGMREFIERMKLV